MADKKGLILFFKERTGLLLLIALFIICKLPHLHYPFYWDESWSYAPGLQLMYRHGPSLMPDAIDTFYSRGHPLLFYASIAGWMRIFGPSHFSMHCFSLTLSVMLIIAVFEAGRRLFNNRVAYSAAIFLAIQVAFFVQASMCLPEILVALLALLSIYFFLTRKYLALYFSLTSLLFTKESGAVAGLLLGAVAAVQLLSHRIPWRYRLLKLASVAAAGISIGLFFLLQKKLNGWYLFPEHTGLIKLEFPLFWGKFMAALEFLFNDDKRYWVFRALAVAAVAGIFKGRKLLALPLLAAILVTGALLNDQLNFVNTKVMLVIIIGLLLAVMAGFTSLKHRLAGTPALVPFVVLSILFFILYLLFTGVNFYTSRYLLCLFPFMAILVSICFELLLESRQFRYGGLLAPCCFLLIGMRAFQRDTTWGDTHLRAYNAMGVQEKMVRFLEHRNYYDSTIGTGSFQANQHLTKPLTGMLSTGRAFSKVRWDMDRITNIVLFDNIEPDERYAHIKNNPEFYRICRVQNGELWAEAYARKKP